jgi:hypothetical protein
MSDIVKFWLDNRNAVGTRVAAIGDQDLVLYRGRYHVVVGGSAQTRGGRPVRYSNSSMPAIWKKALKGATPATASLSVPGAEIMPQINPMKRERKKMDKPTGIEQLQAAAEPVESILQNEVKAPRAPKKAESKTAVQAAVTANCPYCSARHDIPVDKGKSGKPFFMACARCKTDFAVRFVQVSVYQAQVAGFR